MDEISHHILFSVATLAENLERFIREQGFGFPKFFHVDIISSRAQTTYLISILFFRVVYFSVFGAFRFAFHWANEPFRFFVFFVFSTFSKYL